MINNTMIIVPVNNEPSKCPKCGNLEHKIEVCAHCGYQYPDEPTPWYYYLICILIIIVCIWLFITLIAWMTDEGTLLDNLKTQGQWIVALIHRIY